MSCGRNSISKPSGMRESRVLVNDSKIAAQDGFAQAARTDQGDAVGGFAGQNPREVSLRSWCARRS
jgi:hypothetical protein